MKKHEIVNIENILQFQDHEIALLEDLSRTMTVTIAIESGMERVSS